MIPLCLPLMVPMTASMGHLAVVTSSSQRLVVVPVLGVPATGGASQGAIGIKVVPARPGRWELLAGFGDTWHRR
jgi:hypothetical protein